MAFILKPIGQEVNSLELCDWVMLAVCCRVLGDVNMRMTDLNALPIQKELIKAKEEERNSRSYLLHVFNSICAIVCIHIFHFSEKDQRIRLWMNLWCMYDDSYESF